MNNDSKSSQQNQCASVEVTTHEAIQESLAPAIPLPNQETQSPPLGTDLILFPESPIEDVIKKIPATIHQTLNQIPNVASTTPSPEVPQSPHANVANWAAKLRAAVDKKLKKFTNPIFSAEGVPRVKIPDSVFQRGVDLHKDFVIGVFMGRTPSFCHINACQNS